jgi:phage terminase large subunit
MKLKFNTNSNDKQKQCVRYWIDKETTDIVYGGSKGSGKSFLGVSLIFGDAFIYPGTSYFIARKSLTNLRKFTIPSIHEVLNLWGVPNSMYSYNGQDNYFKLSNGSTVYLLDAKYLPSDPEFYRFGSMQMTRGWIEEAGEFEEAAKNNLNASIGRWKNKEYNLTPKLLQTCNPAKNYLYRNYYKNKNSLPIWKKFIQALPTDNKMLPDGYLENLERTLNNNEKQRLLYGNWEFDDDPTALIEYQKILDCFENKKVQIGEKYITADIARFGNDKIIIIEWDGWFGKIHSYTKQATNVTATIIEGIRQRLGISKNNVLVDEDGIGGGIVDFYKCLGFVNNSKAVITNLNNRDKRGNLIPENFDNLKSQCYFRLAELINSNSIHLQCDNDQVKQMIVEELEQVKQKSIDSDLKKGVVPKDKVKELLGRSPDFADAIMMRVYFDLSPKKRYADAIY